MKSKEVQPQGLHHHAAVLTCGRSVEERASLAKHTETGWVLCANRRGSKGSFAVLITASRKRFLFFFASVNKRQATSELADRPPTCARPRFKWGPVAEDGAVSMEDGSLVGQPTDDAGVHGRHNNSSWLGSCWAALQHTCHL